MSALWDVPAMVSMAHALVHPMLLGIDWMDPNWLLDRFGAELFWISIIIVFIECGLFFPISAIGSSIHRSPKARSWASALAQRSPG